MSHQLKEYSRSVERTFKCCVMQEEITIIWNLSKSEVQQVIMDKFYDEWKIESLTFAEKEWYHHGDM